ncbi:MAG: thioesterase family protein [Caldilineaceae bacterium]
MHDQQPATRDVGILALLEGFPVIIDIPVAWGDMDAYQHVNNTVYFRYFESARIAYFDRLAMNDLRAVTGIGPILASVNCRFRIPLTYPDTVAVGARVTTIQADRFEMETVIVSYRHRKVAAAGSGVIVTYNYSELQKALMPPELKARIEALEGHELSPRV